MRTHELAKILLEVSAALRKGPDVEIANLPNIMEESMFRPDKESMAIGINTLVNLSKINKSEWIDFIHKYELPIQWRHRDATRDIIGKILNYLDKDQEELRRVREKIKSDTRGSSSELQAALNILLGNKS